MEERIIFKHGKLFLINEKYPAIWSEHIDRAKKYTIQEAEVLSSKWPFLKSCEKIVVKK